MVKPEAEVKPRAEVKSKAAEKGHEAVSAAIALVTARLEREGERLIRHRRRLIGFAALLLAALIIGAVLLAVMRLS